MEDNIENKVKKDIEGVEEKPKRTNKPFLKKKNGKPKEEFEGFLLLLMKNNGYAEFIENVKAGKFLMKDNETGETKEAMLPPSQMVVFVYNGNYIKGWVLHEDNLLPYPQNPIYGAEMFRKIIQKVAMNYKDVNESSMIQARAKATVLYVVIGLIVLFVLYSVSKNAGWFDSTVVEATANVVKNTTEVAMNTGVGLK